MPAREVVDRLCRAVDAHDLDALVDCFAADYRNDTPAHPSRSFSGRDQVRDNWSKIFEAVPDVTATVLAIAENGESVWSEWEMRGTRRDGGPHWMRGVIVFDVVDARAQKARFYLEPVDEGTETVGEAVTQLVSSRTLP